MILPGFQEDSPIGFLSAVGLAKLTNSKLSWVDGIAVIDRNLDDLTRHLTILAKSRSEYRCWSICDSLNDLSHNWESESRSAISECDLEKCDWLTAFGCRLGVEWRRTHFDLTSGNQKFLKIARKVSESITPQLIKSTLPECWTYPSQGTMLGLDPSSEAKGKQNSVALWLAIEALVVFPVLISSSFDADWRIKNKIRTTAWRWIRKEPEFCWPIWSKPIGITSIKTLVSRACIIQGQKQTLSGVDKIFSSERYQDLRYPRLSPGYRIA